MGRQITMRYSRNNFSNDTKPPKDWRCENCQGHVLCDGVPPSCPSCGSTRLAGAIPGFDNLEILTRDAHRARAGRRARR